ncbi:hypothetical protein MRX96_035220 [Rhipicephalus microplus]
MTSKGQHDVRADENRFKPQMIEGADTPVCGTILCPCEARKSKEIGDFQARVFHTEGERGKQTQAFSITRRETHQIKYYGSWGINVPVTKKLARIKVVGANHLPTPVYKDFRVTKSPTQLPTAALCPNARGGPVSAPPVPSFNLGRTVGENRASQAGNKPDNLAPNNAALNQIRPR